MPDFNPTHEWTFGLGSSGHATTPVEVTGPGINDVFATVKTSGGNTYLARTDELRTLEDQS